MNRARLYVASGALVLLVLLVTLVPAVYPASAQFIFRPNSLTILYAFLSMAIALVVFGVLGDSRALVQLSPGTGQVVRLTGSAAGFVAFFYMFSSGLTPFSFVTVTLYKDANTPLGRGDGAVEVRLDSTVKQIVSTADGTARFAVAKSGEAGRISVRGEEGLGWKIAGVLPKHCLTEHWEISRSCDFLTLYLAPQKTCFDDVSVAWHWTGEQSRTLEGVIRELTDNFRKARTRAPLEFVFSDRALEAQIHKERFPISRAVETPQPVCSHLASVENALVHFKSKRVIRTYTSCDRILVAMADEAPPKEFKPCL